MGYERKENLENKGEVHARETFFFKCSFNECVFLEKKICTDETEQITFQAIPNIYFSFAVTGSDTSQCIIDAFIEKINLCVLSKP